MGGVDEEQRAGGVEGAGGGQLEGGARPAKQLRGQRAARDFQPVMHPVQALRGPRQPHRKGQEQTTAETTQTHSISDGPRVRADHRLVDLHDLARDRGPVVAANHPGRSASALVRPWTVAQELHRPQRQVGDVLVAEAGAVGLVAEHLRKAGMSLASTGVPADIASISTIPKLSPPVLGAL